MKVIPRKNRREWFASLAMGVGLVASYSILAVQAVLFLLPRQLGVPTRRVFAGRISQFEEGKTRTLFDLEGNEVLVRRTSEADFQAFSSTCPHLGCKVRWEDEEQRYFCPCHSGVFDSEGRALSGPPADGGQNLTPVPLQVDQQGGVLYMEVQESGRRRNS